MKIDRNKVTKTFAEYTSHYNFQDEKIRLKVEHTYRVSQLCEAIAAPLMLAKEDVDIAWLLGMLHDVGRFEQLKNFGTFIDAQSVDHAALGAAILFEEGKIRDYIDFSQEDELLETAIRSHNLYRLSSDLDERTGMFCQILRDADKIDILKVNVDFPLEEIFDVSTQKLRTDMVSEAVMSAFFEGHAVKHSLKQSAVDYVVGHISLFYELVYPESRRIIIRQGYLDKLLNFSSENPLTQKQFEQIRSGFSEIQNSSPK